MFRGRGTTSSVIQAAGSPSTGVSARPNALVVLVWTNAPTPAATASSSRTNVPVTFVSTNACREWDIMCGLCSVAACSTASAPATAARTAARSVTDATTSVWADSKRSSPTTSWPEPRSVRTSASPRCPALPVTRMRRPPSRYASWPPCRGPRRAKRVVGGTGVLLFVLRAVAEVGREPSLRLLDRPALAPRIVLDLVAAEATQHEVPRLRVREVQAAHRRPRPHGHALGELDAGVDLGVEQLPDGPLLGVLRACGVARSGPDAVVLLGDEPVAGEGLVGGVAQELLAHPLVQPLGEGLGEPVGQRLQQDGAVVVQRRLELLGLGLAPESGGDREGTDVVPQTGVLGGHEVGERAMRDAGPGLGLLAQFVQHGANLAPRLVGVDLDVVAGQRVGREEPEDALGPQPFLRDDPVEHLLRVVPELAGRLTGRRVVQDVGILALHLPGVEERLPVDVLAQFGDRVVVERAHVLHRVGRCVVVVGVHVAQLLPDEV